MTQRIESSDYLLSSVLSPEQELIDIRISNGMIAEIASAGSLSQGVSVTIESAGMQLLPGLVD